MKGTLRKAVAKGLLQIKKHPFRAAFAAIVIVAAALWPTIEAPTVNFDDIRVADGFAACKLVQVRNGVRGDYVVDGVRYFSRFSMEDGLVMGVCNPAADGKRVSVKYVVDLSAPQRRLLIGIWGPNRASLENLTVEERIELWRRQFVSVWFVVVMRLALVALAIALLFAVRSEQR